MQLLDAAGQVLDAQTIRHSHSGLLELSDPLAVTPAELAGRSYEIISPSPAPILAIRLFLGLRCDETIPPCDIKLGTTKGTNALLTRTGSPTAFVTTRGFGDLLRIGYQNRPRIVDRNIVLPELLYERVIEVDERVRADGTVLRAPDLDALEPELRAAHADGIDSVATHSEVIDPYRRGLPTGACA